ncbi:MAG: hypothetical protein ABSF34_01880 [Verrucomicrobiota bacterium]|jgi:hypothetical protein
MAIDDHGLVAGEKDFLMIWRGISGSHRDFAFCRSPMHLAFRRRLFVPVFMRFFNGKLAGIQKAGDIDENDEKAEWRR